MAKLSKSYYSVAVPHPELPGAFLASFAIPGHAPEWIMENRSQKIFITPESAEIAGFRAMMARMNLANQAQNFTMKSAGRIRATRPDKTQVGLVEAIKSKSRASQVFSRFKRTDTV